MNARSLVNSAWNEGLRPPPLLSVAEWADANRKLGGSSSEPGPYRTERTPYLREIMECLAPSHPAREIDFMKGSQIGAPLALETPIPTAAGWTTMGAIAVGEQVFDENGSPCSVLYTSPVFEGRKCYAVTFSDHSVLKADADHLWSVDDDKKSGRTKKRVLTTAEIAQTFKVGERNRYAIRVAEPLHLKEVALQIAPYALGAWLGDGNACSNQVTTHSGDAEIADYVTRSGHPATARYPKWLKGKVVNIIIEPIEHRVGVCGRGHDISQAGTTYTSPGANQKVRINCVQCRRLYQREYARGEKLKPIERRRGFHAKLKDLNLLNNKHIPAPYLRGSYQQRLELLQGLMDTDGSIAANGRCEFSTTNEALCKGVYELLMTLGIKATVTRAQARLRPAPSRKGGGGSVLEGGQDIHRISFLTYNDKPVFRLPRKLQRMVSTEGRRPTETKRRRIVSVEEIESVATRCIGVDSPSHLFLAGESMIPTHNTETGFNWIGYVIAESPANIMCVLPDMATAKEWSQQRLSQLTEETECLRGRIQEARSRDGGNSTFSKKFGTCYLKMAWASSPKKMRTTPAAFIVADEVDGFKRDSGGEGNPIALLRRRQTNFPESKFYRVSTPSQEPSLIEEGFLEGDQRYFFLPCPACGHYQRLVFGQLKLTEDEGVRYACIACEERIPERFKSQMLAGGRFIATKLAPQVKDAGIAAEELPSLEPVFRAMTRAVHPSFHVSALYSPLGWYSWTSVARDWRLTQGSTANLKTFINTVLGEVWKHPSEVPDWKRLAERAEKYTKVPMGGLFLTAGVDIQKNRHEIQVRAWGERKENWLIDYVVLEGKSSEDAVWELLTDFVQNSRYEHESGVELPIAKVGIDSNYETQQVYHWVRKQNPLQVIALHGVDTGQVPVTPPKYLDVARDGKTSKRGISTRTVNVSLLKGELYGWLNQDAPTKEELAGGAVYPSGYVHNNAQPDEYFQQLVAERIVTHIENYVETFSWVKTRERNEALDTFVYARAASIIYGLDRAKPADFEKLRAQFPDKPMQKERITETLPLSQPSAPPVQQQAIQQPPPSAMLRPGVTRSKWLDR